MSANQAGKPLKSESHKLKKWACGLFNGQSIYSTALRRGNRLAGRERQTLWCRHHLRHKDTQDDEDEHCQP